MRKLSKLSRLLFTNRSSVEGYRIVKDLGTVSGSCCESGGSMGDFANSVQNAVGGAMPHAAYKWNVALRRAMRRALKEAEKCEGANGVVNMREQVTTTFVRRIPFIPMWWLPPVTLYFTHVSGTAVVMEKIEKAPGPAGQARASASGGKHARRKRRV